MKICFSSLHQSVCVCVCEREREREREREYRRKSFSHFFLDDDDGGDKQENFWKVFCLLFNWIGVPFSSCQFCPSFLMLQTNNKSGYGEPMKPYAIDLTLSFGFCYYFTLWLFFKFLISCLALPCPLAS